jgi:hypothetical protein
MIIYDRASEAIVEAGRWLGEADLDRFLLQHPEVMSRLLTGDSERAVFPLAGNGIAAQYLQIDALFLFVDPDGKPSLVVVEDKLQCNQDLKRRRSALGQVLEYCASLLTEPDATFEEELRKRLASEEWRRTYAECQQRMEDWGLAEEEIISLALAAKRAGRVRLLLCAESIPAELRTAVAWLNGMKIAIDACEIVPTDRAQRRLVTAATLIAGALEADARSLATDPEMREQVRSLVGALKDAEWLVSILEVTPRCGTMVSARATEVEASTAAGSNPDRIDPSKWGENADENLRRLHEILNQRLALEGSWRTGAGDLCLDLKTDPVVKALRLRRTTFTFVARKDLAKIGDSNLLDWYDSKIREFPVRDASKPQPSVGGDDLARIVAAGAPKLISFIQELFKRLTELRHE